MRVRVALTLVRVRILNYYFKCMDANIFQNLAFPLALAVFLLVALRSVYRSYIDYLKNQNDRLINALNANTQIFKELVDVLKSLNENLTVN